jgi:hypothetical protein
MGSGKTGFKKEVKGRPVGAALFFEHKHLNINIQLRFKTGVQALPALQAELALQNPGKLSLDYLLQD